MGERRGGDHPWVEYQHMIVFDGVCNFCNASVDFVMARDPQQKYKFGTLQSDAGQAMLLKNNLSTQDFETFLYIEHGTVFTKSTAALKVAKGLTGAWPLLYGFIVVPKSIRDSVYQFIARRRYQWMGKRAVCRLPSESERSRFV
ncbi:MAG: thiol-disulfide oxidoreductase DCC family protein [Nitrospirales bacterium]